MAEDRLKMFAGPKAKAVEVVDHVPTSNAPTATEIPTGVEPPPPPVPTARKRGRPRKTPLPVQPEAAAPVEAGPVTRVSTDDAPPPPPAAPTLPSIRRRG